MVIFLVQYLAICFWIETYLRSCESIWNNNTLYFKNLGVTNAPQRELPKTETLHIIMHFAALFYKVEI